MPFPQGLVAAALELYHALAACLAHLPVAVVEGKLKVNLDSMNAASEVSSPTTQAHKHKHTSTR